MIDLFLSILNIIFSVLASFISSTGDLINTQGTWFNYLKIKGWFVVGLSLGVVFITGYQFNSNNVEQTRSKQVIDSLKVYSKTNSQLSGEIINIITGGKGYFVTVIYPDSANSADVDVQSQTKYPLEGVKLTIKPWFIASDFRLSDFDRFAYKELTNFKDTYTIDVGSVAPKDSISVLTKSNRRIPFDRETNWIYTINVQTKNDEWNQISEVRFDENKIPYFSYIVYRTIVENDIIKKIVLKELVNPKMKDSIIPYMIKEQKLSFGH